MWSFDVTCGFVRFPPGGAPVVFGHRLPWADRLVPDRSGGMWFTSDLAPGGGHIDATGRITLLRGLGRGTFDVAVAADGSAWFATRTCSLVRATPDGAITRTRVPIPVCELEFDPAGAVYLASRVRLQRTTLGAPAAGCDDRPPRVQIKPNAVKRVSLAALRRNRGFTITVREPFAMEAFLTDPGEDPFSGADAVVTSEVGRTVRIPIARRKLRQLARRKNPALHLLADVRDREGNYTAIDMEVRIGRWMRLMSSTTRAPRPSSPGSATQAAPSARGALRCLARDVAHARSPAPTPSPMRRAMNRANGTTTDHVRTARKEVHARSPRRRRALRAAGGPDHALT